MIEAAAMDVTGRLACTSGFPPLSCTSAGRRASSPDEIVVVGAGSVRPRLPFDRAGVRSVREGIPLPATAEARSEGEGSKNGQAHDPGIGPHTTVSLEDGDRRTA